MTEEKNTKKLPLPLIAGAAGVVIVAIILIKVLFFSYTTLNPTDYVKVSVEGLNGEGKIILGFDYDILLADIAGDKELSATKENAIRSILADASAQYEVSKEEALANGDSVTITSTFDKNILKKQKVKFKNDKITYEVSDLTEIQTLAMADYITTDFYGFDGYGNAYIEVDTDALYEELEKRILAVDDNAQSFIDNNLSYYVYNTYVENRYFEDLKNKDNISTVIVSDMGDLEKYGIRVTDMEYTGVVDGLTPTEKLSLADYVIYTMEGFNGAGRIYADIDYEKLTADLTALFTKDNRSSYGNLADGETVDAESAAESVVSDWKYDFVTEFSVSDALYNDDVVTVNCYPEYEEEFFDDNVGIYLDGFTAEVTMEGLTEPEEVALSEALSVSFSGICPEIYVDITVDYEKPYARYTSLYDLYDQYIVAYNGGTFAGEITYDEQQLLEMGYKVKDSSYEFVIEGLPSYDFTMAGLEEEKLQWLIESGYQKVSDWLGRYSSDVLDDLNENQGWIRWDETKISLLTARKGYCEEEHYDFNQLQLTYCVNIPFVQKDRSVVYQNIYGLVCFYDITEETDGTLVCDSMDFWMYYDTESLQAKVSELDGRLNEGKSFTELTAAPEEMEVFAGAVEVLPAMESTIQSPVLPAEIQAQASKVLTYKNSAYALIETPQNWKKAEEFCESYGGHLATITSEEEASVVRSLLEGSNQSEYWIGGTDKENEGIWTWVTGEAFDWTNWYSYQPDDHKGENEDGEDGLTVGHGYNYAWNDNSQTNEIGLIYEINTEVTGISLADLTAAELNRVSVRKEGFQDPYGNQHFRSVALDASEDAWAIYDLNGRYSSLSGNFTTWTEAGSEASFELAVWGDGVPLLMCYDYKKSDAPVNFNIDLTGVDILTIQAYNRGDYGNGFLFLNETNLVVNPEPIEFTEKKINPNGLKLINGKNYEIGKDLCIDVQGDMHNGTIRLIADKDAYILWNLEGKYTGFTGSLIAEGSAYSDETAVSAAILADGEVLFEITDLTKYDGKQDFSLDLTGRQTLEVRATCKEDAYDIGLKLIDAVLTEPVVPEAAEAVAALEFPALAPEVQEKVAAYLISGDKIYYRIDEAVTWKQAVQFCKNAGGVMPDYETDRQQAIVKYLWEGGLNGYWVKNDSQKDSDRTYGVILVMDAISGAMPAGGIDLADLTMKDGSRTDIKNVYASKTKTYYTGALQMDASNEAWASYRLDGNYASIQGTIAKASNASDGVKFQVAIFGDGKLLYELRDYTKDKAEVPFNLDLTGVQELHILTRNDGSYNDGYVFLNGVKLYPAAQAAVSSVKRMNELIAVDASGTSMKQVLTEDSFGNLCDGYNAFKGRDNAYVLYNLNQSAAVFRGTITTKTEWTGREAVFNISIDADGTNIFKLENYRQEDGPVPFEIDVTGKTTLEIRVEETAGVNGDHSWLMIVNEQIQ